LSIGPGVYATKWSDGSVSTRSLNGLARVRKQGEVVDLGDREYCEADSGLFVLPA
jgi:hypothetical protein